MEQNPVKPPKDERLPADPVRAVRDTEHIWVHVPVAHSQHNIGSTAGYKLTCDRLYHRLPNGGKGARWIQRVTPDFIRMMVDDEPDNLQMKVMLYDLMEEERREDAQARAYVEMMKQNPPSDRFM